MDGWIGGSGDAYRDIVWRAVTDAATFARFRGDPAYRSILEHVSKADGDRLIASVRNPHLVAAWRGSEAADRVGGAVTDLFDGCRISPTTLRYANMVQDLIECFPRLHAARHIVEIGIGYGGQARLLADYARRAGWALDRITLIDLLPVTRLAQTWLDHFPLQPTCDFRTRSELGAGESYDLAVSNYAFSEFDRTLQADYLGRVLLRARAGYLTMNSGLPGLPPRHADGHDVHELLALLPNAIVLRERPATSPLNYVIVFGEHGIARGIDVDRHAAAARRLIGRAR